MPDCCKENILYLDNHLLVIRKPAGILIQGDDSGDVTILQLCKDYLKEEFGKPGNVFLGLVHRLDRPVSGVVVFARTSKAASRLTDQFRNRETVKVYRALIQGKVEASGVFEDYISRHRVTSHLSTPEKGKYAKLSFARLKFENDLSFVEVRLETGRHHQIRVQFGRRGFPILGDFRYGSKKQFDNKTIALHAQKLSFFHPITKEQMEFTSDVDEHWNNYIKLI
jgi:23S rRNA pseudouridine1911/1915/1917 synthase